VPELL